RLRGSMVCDPEQARLLQDLRTAEERLTALVGETETVRARIAELQSTLRLRDQGLQRSLPLAPPTERAGLRPPPATSSAKIALFRGLFRGRPDVFPKLWENAKTGKKGYSPACANEWRPGVCEKPRIKCGDCPNRNFLAVDDRRVLDHLQGRSVMGVY